MKRTEIGLIPNDWEIINLGDVFEFKNGLNKAKNFFGFGTPIINYTDVYKNRGLLKENVKGKVYLNSDEINRFETKKGDVFFTRTSETPEEVGISSVLLDNIDNCVFSGFILRARPKKKIFTLDFCKYCFSTKEVRDAIIKSCTYTTRALTNGSLLSKISIPLPPIEEQKRIAQALSDVDAVISTTEKLIAKKKALKQGAMQTLLSGKMRIQNGKWIKTANFKQTELGLIPQEWDAKPLGALCSLFGRIGFRGYTRNDLVEKHRGAITFSPSDIHDQKIDFSDCTYISLFKYEESPEIKVKNGDILLGKTASIGKCALIENLHEKATINPQFVLMKNFKCDNHYLYYQLIDKPFQTNIWSICGGSTIPTMSQEKLKRQLILCPKTIEEQTAIATVLSDMDSEIAALETKLAKYRQLKTGMMQQLLTGKVRLVSKGD